MGCGRQKTLCDTVVPEYELVLADASAIHGLEQAETNPRDPVWTFAAGIVQIAIGASEVLLRSRHRTGMCRLIPGARADGSKLIAEPARSPTRETPTTATC